MNITVLGLGAMGSRMAQRLVAAGHAVTVYNRSAAAAEPLRAAGARVAHTPAEAAASAEIVISMLHGDEASRSVWLGQGGAGGALSAMPTTALAIECSTLSHTWALALHQAALAAGKRLIDAPVVGSRPQADAGQLIVLAAGAVDDVTLAHKPLSAFAGKVLHLGDAGQGALVKLMINTLFATQLASLAELLGAAKAHGADVAAVLDAMAQTPVLSPAAQGAGKLMLAGLQSGQFPPAFPVALVQKDLAYAQALRPERLPITQAVQQVLNQASAAGHSASNLTAVAALYS
jgi:3-hydroxyisobutyrate dehydrogenase